MSLSRLFAGSALFFAALAQPVLAADGSSRLLQSVPAGAPMIMHVRDISLVQENWEHTPFAKMWADPAVRAFFAPAAELLTNPEAQKGLADLQEATGMTVPELIELLPGEYVVAVLSIPMPGADTDQAEPEVIMGAALGENRARLEKILAKVRASEAGKDGAEAGLTEEFQGETLHLTFKTDQATGEKSAGIAWAVVDDVVWAGSPKAVLQQTIANFKNGGAPSPIGTSAGFGSVYQRDPGAQAAFYLDLESFVRLVQTQVATLEAAKKQAAEVAATEGGEPVTPTMFEQMGLTPEIIMHALGLDALRGAYATLNFDRRAMSMTAGVTWTEQRGILRWMAYGDAPAPQPHFVPPDWTGVSTMRVKPAEFLEAIKETARTANPMLEFMLMQQLAGLKQQIGIDVEQDFFGALGDEMVVGSIASEAGSAGGFVSGEQLWAMSLANAESFSRVLDVVWSMAPAVAQRFQTRDYLGHVIRTINVPLPGPEGGTFLPIAYAITPTYLFIDINGSSMIETAIQRLNGEGEQFWTQPAVVAALQTVPPGGCSFAYQEMGPVVRQVFDQWVTMIRMADSVTEQAPGEPELDENGRPLPPRPPAVIPASGLRTLIDPDAVPDTETIAKYWGTSTGALYRDNDGIRYLMRLNNVE